MGHMSTIFGDSKTQSPVRRLLRLSAPAGRFPKAGFALAYPTGGVCDGLTGRQALSSKAAIETIGDHTVTTTCWKGRSRDALLTTKEDRDD